MARFDPGTWGSRVAARYRRALALGQPDATIRFVIERDSIVHLEKVVGWCTTKGIDVVFDGKFKTMYDGSERLIRCNSRTRPDVQLYLLLHECGHHLIGTHVDGERFSQGYSAHDPGIKRSLAHRIDIIDEELEAWHRGKRLAKRLGISLDTQAYDRLRSRLVKTHMSWALKVNGFEGEGSEDGDDQTT